MPNFNSTFDAGLQLKDAGAITASAAGTVSAAAAVRDLGSAHVSGDWVVDVATRKVSAGDERYTVCLEGCNTQDFSAQPIVPLAIMAMGHSSVIVGAGATNSALGVWNMPFRNEQGGTVYRYVRAYVEIAGTSPSFDYESHLTTRKA